MSQLPHLVRDLIAIMHQGGALISALTPAAYCGCPEAFKSSSIGAHYRHHLEHVQLLLDGVCGEVDYDQRRRDPALERDIQAALTRTEELVAKLRTLSEQDLDRQITIVHQSSVESSSRPSCSSTLGRELLFVLSHAVHHYALMGVIAQAQGQRPCDESFGVMPSTLRYQADQRRSS